MQTLLLWWMNGARRRSLTSVTWLAIAAFSVNVSSVSADESDKSASPGEVLFEDMVTLDEQELADNSGGTQLSLGDLGLNIASNKAELNGNSVSGNVNTGQITDNSLSDVSGINSLMFNTGNNVNFQSNMQINIFLK
jgi:hypothetical protein